MVAQLGSLLEQHEPQSVLFVLICVIEVFILVICLVMCLKILYQLACSHILAFNMRFLSTDNFRVILVIVAMGFRLINFSISSSSGTQVKYSSKS